MSNAGTPQWHAERMKGLGGSDAAAALGLSKWKSPYALYLEKTGEAEPIDATWDMKRGTAMEPLLRQHFADTFQCEVKLPISAVVHPKHAFMRYNPDGFTDDGVLAEFKTARFPKGWGVAGTDEIPQDYMIQVQHGLFVMGFEVCRPSVSIAFGEPVYYEVPANKELQEMIIYAEAEFWQRVQDRNPPEPTTAEDVAKRFSVAKEGRVVATPEILILLQQLRDIKSIIKDGEVNKDATETEIKKFMGENDTLIHETGAILATWKQAKGAERIDSKRLKAEQPAITAQYTTIGEATRRLLIK